MDEIERKSWNSQKLEMSSQHSRDSSEKLRLGLGMNLKRICEFRCGKRQTWFDLGGGQWIGDVFGSSSRLPSMLLARIWNKISAHGMRGNDTVRILGTMSFLYTLLISYRRGGGRTGHTAAWHPILHHPLKTMRGQSLKGCINES